VVVSRPCGGNDARNRQRWRERLHRTLTTPAVDRPKALRSGERMQPANPSPNCCRHLPCCGSTERRGATPTRSGWESPARCSPQSVVMGVRVVERFLWGFPLAHGVGPARESSGLVYRCTLGTTDRMPRLDYQPFDLTRQFLSALCTPSETPGVSKVIRDRAAVCLKEVWDCTVRDALRVSTGPTGNQWFTIPDPPEK